MLPAIAYGVLIAILTAARHGYFGDMVPNTFYSKPGNVVLQINNLFEFLTGHTANIPFPIVGILALVPLGLGYRMLRRVATAGAHMLAAAIIAGFLFCLYSRPDWTLHGRYFAPYLPAAAILFWIGIVGFAVPFVERLRPRAQRHHAVAAAAIIVFVGLLGVARAMVSMDFFPGYVLAGRTLVEPARWMRDNLPADATIATRRIGALAYVSERRVFDYTYGLTEREVARLIALRGKPFYNPAEPGLAPVWKWAAPRYVIEDENILDSIARDGEGTLEKFTVHGFEYRVIRRFPIGRTVLWALAERTDPGALAGFPDTAPATYSDAFGSLSSPSGGSP
ncbi:MAG: hypothetical protein FJX67_11775 [Alphaproteobacteria bacterium]|nr:hypothetical protein [Alphaproteobacteria bacterium]